METNSYDQTRVITRELLDEKNKDITDDLMDTLMENRRDVERLRRKLTVTFWVIIIMSIVIFIIGVVLLSVPVVAAIGGQIDRLNSLIAAGFGIADLIGLVLYGPIEKIQKLMGNMSQLILVLNSHQTEVNLRLLEIDFLGNRPSVGTAADKIGSITKDSVKLIQEYFEEPAAKK